MDTPFLKSANGTAHKKKRLINLILNLATTQTLLIWIVLCYSVTKGLIYVFIVF